MATTLGTETIVTDSDPFALPPTDEKPARKSASELSYEELQERIYEDMKDMLKTAGVDVSQANNREDIIALGNDPANQEKLLEASNKDKNFYDRMIRLMKDQQQLEYKEQEREQQKRAEERKEVQQAVDQIDENRDGLLTPEERKKTTLSDRQLLGLEKDSDVDQWVKQNSATVNGNAYVFSKGAQERISDLSDKVKDKNDTAAIMEEFDRNQDGKLDTHEREIVQAAAVTNKDFGAMLAAKGINVADIGKTMASNGVVATAPGTTGPATNAPEQPARQRDGVGGPG